MTPWRKSKFTSGGVRPGLAGVASTKVVCCGGSALVGGMIAATRKVREQVPEPIGGGPERETVPKIVRGTEIEASSDHWIGGRESSSAVPWAWNLPSTAGTGGHQGE